MKKILLALSSLLCSAGLMAGVATAQEPCTITNTGADSTNITECVEVSEFVVTCTNNTVVTINNNQTANSGSSITISNTNGSFTTSTGEVVNVNSDNVALNVGCAPVAVVTPPTPTPTPPAVQPAVGGQGQAAPEAKALPVTGDDSLVSSTAVAAAVLGSVAVLSRIALSAYRHFSLK